MNKLVVANWKMFPVKPAEAKKLFIGIQKGLAGQKTVQAVVCPPVVHLPVLAELSKGAKIQLGVQDCFYQATGPYTGAVSADMVQSYKAKWTILGHSERRERGETNDDVGEKARYAIRSGLTAIVCVGERERADDGAYYTFVRNELEALFVGLKRKELEKLVVAYEPIWAIGKSAEEAMRSAELIEMILYIKKILIERFGRKAALAVRVLYGGSVKPDNARALMETGIDGFLVGSASLDPQAFTSIVTTAAAA